MLRMNFVQWVTVTVNSIAKNYIHKNLHALSPQFFFRYGLLSRNISNMDFLKNQNQKQTQKKTKNNQKKYKKAQVSWRAELGYTVGAYAYTVKYVIKGSEMV